MINYYSEIKPVLNKLRKLNVFDSLDVIRKYVYTSIYRKNVGYIQGIESPQYYGIEVYFADFLIKNSLIYSSIVREDKSLVQAKTRKEVCKPIIDLQHIQIDDFTYMPNKQFHACLLAFEQNFCKTYEIKKDIIRIAQSYRDYHSKEKYSINDDEFMLISSRDMERDIPLIANNGIAKVMEWEHNGDIFKYKEDNTYLRNLCKSTLLDKLLLDINEKVVKLGNM